MEERYVDFDVFDTIELALNKMIDNFISERNPEITRATFDYKLNSDDKTLLVNTTFPFENYLCTLSTHTVVGWYEMKPIKLDNFGIGMSEDDIVRKIDEALDKGLKRIVKVTTMMGTGKTTTEEKIIKIK